MMFAFVRKLESLVPLLTVSLYAENTETNSQLDGANYWLAWRSFGMQSACEIGRTGRPGATCRSRDKDDNLPLPLFGFRYHRSAPHVTLSRQIAQLSASFAYEIHDCVLGYNRVYRHVP